MHGRGTLYNANSPLVKRPDNLLEVQREVTILILIITVLLCAFRIAPAAPIHPNLILNKEEIQEIREKVRTQPWAAKILERMKHEVQRQDPDSEFHLSAAVLYALTRDRQYIASALPALSTKATEWQQPLTQYIWNIGGEEAIIYDLLYDALDPPTREQFEHQMRQGARHAIDYANSKRQTWNMFWIQHAQVALIGFVTGDQELIDWGMNDSGGGSFEKIGHKRYGGFYQGREACTKDGAWAEPNAYAYYIVLPYLVAVAEAQRHYDGTDLWTWKSPKGNTLKHMFDRALDRTYPGEQGSATGLSYRMASFGDAGTQSDGDFWLANISGVSTGSHQWRFDLGSLFDVAYARTGDSRYAWVATRDATRDIAIRPLGYAALLYGKSMDPSLIKPPPAPSAVMTNLGMAMLRADESPGYWTGKGLAVFFMMGAEVGHEHQDLHEIM